jgi:dethiobiotin synthetase
MLATLRFFIAGTDTGCGKTEVTLALMAALKQQGLKVAGMKPVASGGRTSSGCTVNEDAARIQAASSMVLDYDCVCPWSLPEPVAPHIAAARAGLEITTTPVVKAFAALSQQADAVLVEGIGGWRVPLSDTLHMPDLVALLHLPVILVVGLRLGCINHALLSVDGINNDDGVLMGWIANHVDPDYSSAVETVGYLTRTISAPLLGEISFMQGGVDPITAAARLDLAVLK